MTDYNYDAFSTDDYDFSSAAGPEVGDRAPNFLLTTSAGEEKYLLDFTGDFLVLETGSITCPLFQSRRTIMEPLDQEFSEVENAVLYVREAHPGDVIQNHKSFGDKKACAAKLKDEDGETRLIFIDDFDGMAHRAYGSMPNAVFIINQDGRIVFRSDWNNPSATRSALQALTQGQPIQTKSYFRPPLPSTALKTFRQAGKGSASDFFRGLPYLIWMNIVKRNLRLLFSKPGAGPTKDELKR